MGKPIVEPMDHKTFLSNLPIGTRQKLLIRSNRAGIKHLAIHWGLIALTSGLIVLPVPFWPLLLPIQGVLLISNFMLLHECTHRTPFSSIWLNETVGWIAGIIVGLPFLWFRYFHLVHHKHTNDPAQDPELVGHPKPENWRQYLWHVSGIPTWTTQAVGILKIAGGQDELTYVPPSKKRMVRVESVIIVIF
ncbi:MAG: fatty acid desaturase [Paracoccaceae bacterium]|jgi:fatty acid desaturase